ncbi:hypothetical protein FRC12_022358 [Ceratobasidium sp. 428]|nr:hypothetical protein FRC12_022358 [Ceratobasidium sp. 428]
MPVSHPSRHDSADPSAYHLRKQNSNNALAHPDSHPAGNIASGSSLTRVDQATQAQTAPSMREKLRCFREREPVLCPASPPTPELTLLSEEEYRKKSQERIDAMAQRLSSVPLYQARCMINLACTQLEGPFKEGCRFWGTGIPIAMAPTDLALNNAGPVPDTPQGMPPPPRRPSPPSNTADPPLIRFSFPPPAPGVPSTPLAVRSLDVELVPAKTSVGRTLIPADAEVLHDARSPTPTPARPPASSQVPRSSQFPAPSQSSRLSQTAIIAFPPETPKSHCALPVPELLGHPLASVARRPSKLCSQGPQIFPQQSTPIPLGSLGEDEPLSRETSPLLRFSQREPSQIQKSASQRHPPRFSPSKILSEHDSSGDDFFNSQLNLDRRFEDIAEFMGDDIAN